MDLGGEQTKISLDNKSFRRACKCGAQLYFNTDNGNYGSGAGFARDADIHECNNRIHNKTHRIQQHADVKGVESQGNDKDNKGFD